MCSELGMTLFAGSKSRLIWCASLYPLQVQGAVETEPLGSGMACVRQALHEVWLV